MNSKIVLWITLMAILLLGYIAYIAMRPGLVSGPAPKTAIFNCEDQRSITATFYPTDDRYVDLVLSDGRELSVSRAISASGARYANADESFVFWNKGDTAFITENGATTFAGCAIAE